MFSLVLVLTNYKHVWNNCSELDNHNHMAQCNLFNVVNNVILKISRWWFVISRSCFLILKTFAYQPRFTREISKFQKSELGKFIPNFPLKHVITSTNVSRVVLVSTMSVRKFPDCLKHEKQFLLPLYFCRTTPSPFN